MTLRGGTHWEQPHPPLLEAGTYAADPEPYGPPRRLWEKVGAQEAAARGAFAPVASLSDGPSGSVLLAPGDMRGTGRIADRRLRAVAGGTAPPADGAAAARPAGAADHGLGGAAG